MPRWRSTAIGLVALGAASGLAACGRPAEPEYRRNGYATQADCLRDYPAHQCSASTGAGVGGSGLVYGPWFFADRGRAPAGDPGPGATARNGQSQIAQPAASQTRRGGFGTTGRNGAYRGG